MCPCPSVFVGKVIGISSEKMVGKLDKVKVSFAVSSSWKGTSEEENVSVVVSAGSQFTEGEEYLVYAYETTADNYLYKYEEGELATDTLCNGSKLLSLASEDMEQLNEQDASIDRVYYIVVPLVLLFLMAALYALLKQRNRGNPT